MKRLLTFCFLASSAIFCAQNNALVWANSFTGSLNQTPVDVAYDASGNVYTTGWFEGTGDFDPSVAVNNMVCAGVRDMFVTKFDAQGNFIWAMQIGSTSSDAGTSIVVDANDNVIISGYFKSVASAVDLDPTAGVFNATTGASGAAFLLKLSATGAFVWAKVLNGTGQTWPKKIKLDATGSVFCTGNFVGTCDFDPGAATVNATAAGSFSDGYILKLDANGNYIWSKTFGGSEAENSNSIDLDNSGNVIVTGDFSSTADFDPSASTFNLSTGSTSIRNIFILKVSSSGLFVWAKQFVTSSNYNSCFDVIIDASNNIYTTGYFNTQCDFDPNAGVQNLTTTSSSDYDIYVSKLDASGNYVWARNFGNNSTDAGGYGIAKDINGDLYVTGNFNGTIDFDPSSNVSNLTSVGNSDVFILKLDPAANFMWAVKMGGSAYDRGEKIKTDAFLNVFAVGFYQNNADFDPNACINTLSWTGAADGFVQKLNACIPPQAPVSTTPSNILNGCEGDVIYASVSSTACLLNWYQTATSTVSTYTGTTLNLPFMLPGVYNYYVEALTCAPSATRTVISVTVNQLPIISVQSTTNTICSGNSATLTANGAATYTWTGGTIASSINVSPVATTVFSVVGTNSLGCNNNSSFNLTVIDCGGNPTSINSNATEQLLTLKVFPNPTSGLMILNSKNETNIVVTNIIGSLVFSKNLNAGTNELNLSELPSGIYFIISKNQTFKIIKE